MHCRLYMASVKLKIIAEAERGNQAADHKCDVSESCIRDWRKRNFCCRKVVNPIGLLMGNNRSFHK
jgi:hypothetical protein